MPIRRSSRSFARGSWALLLFVGCATPTNNGARPLIEGLAVDVDAALPGEVVALTRDLVRARRDSDDETAVSVVRLLEARLVGEPGIEVTTVQGRARPRTSLRARLPGDDPALPPIVLLAHASSSPVDAARWGRDAPPYEAVTRGEHLVGRGVLDMHGPTALFALTLVALARSELPRARDVVLVVTGDDEGESLLLEESLIDWPELATASCALTEGGLMLQDGVRAGEDLVTVAWAEKGRIALTVSTRAERAPAHRPAGETATGRLVRALDRVRAFDEPKEPTAAAVYTAAALARARGGLAALLARNEGLTERWLTDDLALEPHTRTVLHHGCVITRVGSVPSSESLPVEASADVVCGILPGSSPGEVRDALLLAIDDPRVDVTWRSAVAPSASPPESAVVDVLRERMQREHAGIPVVPMVAARPSLAGALRARGVPVYGFVPILVDLDEADSALSQDERARTRELEDALSRVVDVVATLAR